MKDKKKKKRYCAVDLGDGGRDHKPRNVLLLLLLSRFSRVQLCDPMDGSPSGSPVPGILQARTLEWVAISFSNAWKWKVKVKLLSRIQLFATPWTAAYQALLSMGFSRQEYWSGVSCERPSKAGNGKETKYFLDPCLPLDFRSSDLQNWKLANLFCFKPLHLW